MNTLNSIHSTDAEGPSFQKALFKLWMDLENNLQIVTDREPAPSIENLDTDKELDEIIDAQDQIANAVCHSRAETFEDLLYKVAMWRSDTPDFETMPINADRKDRIIYSVFRDLIEITGITNVTTNVDDRTNFLGI